MLVNGCRLRYIACLIAAAVVIADSAGAQQKIGESDGVGGFDNAFYTVRLSGPAAFARGGTEVATQTGAAGFLANPANLRLDGRWEVSADGAFMRETVNYRPGGGTYFSSRLSHNASPFNSATAVIRAGRFTAGLAVSMPREFENVQHWSAYEITYEDQFLIDDSLFFAVKQWQLSAGVGTNLLESLRFGFTVHLLNFQLRYEDYWSGSYFPESGMTLNQQVLLFQVGLKQTAGDFDIAVTVKSPEDTELGTKTFYGSMAGVFPVRIPAEFAAGTVYHNLISAEFKVLILDDRYYQHDAFQFGGGLHLPLSRLIKRDGAYANIGVVHRANPKYMGEVVDQTFLNTGIELEFGRLGVAATYSNGSLLDNSRASVSELAISLKYYSD